MSLSLTPAEFYRFFDSVVLMKTDRRNLNLLILDVKREVVKPYIGFGCHPRYAIEAKDEDLGIVRFNLSVEAFKKNPVHTMRVYDVRATIGKEYKSFTKLLRVNFL